MTPPASAPSPSTGRPPDTRSPFVRLADLLAGVAPGRPAINLSIGEPQHPVPDFVAAALVSDIASLGRYPAGKGTAAFRTAAAAWTTRRYDLPRPLDPEREVLVLNGSREGLFLGAHAAKRYVTANRGPRPGRPAVLVPNPFYAAYPIGGDTADCEVVYLPAREQSGFLPDLSSLDAALLARIQALRLEAGRRMGLGDVSGLVVPKVGLLSVPRRGGTLTSRYFVPDRCHRSHAVTGGLCVAVASRTPGTVAYDLASPAAGEARRAVAVEHPSGRIDIDLAFAADGTVTRAGVVRTARRIFEGSLLVPAAAFG